ncbi:hypothetical protein HMPREF0973_01529 [Prevotella veroralis F0319]|uniref:Uncharacterized protein n=1 Tax=Prevotella veroralis F0319 TaxID=649761 RepID=C9MPI8_9BACT|nr:hypothetical protein HMPREF0973_01529 [Prevotella veroralis F0319]
MIVFTPPLHSRRGVGVRRLFGGEGFHLSCSTHFIRCFSPFGRLERSTI